MFRALLLFAIFLTGGVMTGFGQVDVPRRTTAITYPLDESVTVQFRGTTRFPRMKGEAKIKRTSRNGSEINLSVSKMPRPFELGAGYATYVLWAISPEGQVDNLGEIKRRGFFEFDSKMRVTTKLQTFALIVTAEPHFLVRRPSQAIMLENLSPYTASGRAIPTMASVQYFGNSSDYFRDSRTPEIAEIDYSKTPSTILQAKQAVALARFAGADRDAAQELEEATRLLSSAEEQWRAGRAEEDVDIAARRSISAAVKAESMAAERRIAREKRDEKVRSDAETRQAENRYQEALDEIEDLKRQLRDETRNRELSERDGANFTQQIKDLRAENAKLREQLAATRIQADTAKTKLESIEKDRANEMRAAALREYEPQLMQTLKQFGTVARTDRGIVLTMPENLWSGIRSSNLAPNGDAKLASLGDILSRNTDYTVAIESHTDDSGDQMETDGLTRDRANLIGMRLSTYGVAQDRIQAKGMGAALPVAPNSTNSNRAKNRRVMVILTPKI